MLLSVLLGYGLLSVVFGYGLLSVLLGYGFGMYMEYPTH